MSDKNSAYYEPVPGETGYQAHISSTSRYPFIILVCRRAVPDVCSTKRPLLRCSTCVDSTLTVCVCMLAEGEGPEEYTFPDNPTASDYAMHPVRMFSNFTERLQHNFGWRFAIQIGIMYVCVKGLLMSTLGLVKLSYCKKTLHVDGNACQTMSAIGSTPWSIKGVFGVLSDSYAASFC